LTQTKKNADLHLPTRTPAQLTDATALQSPSPQTTVQQHRRGEIVSECGDVRCEAGAGGRSPSRLAWERNSEEGLYEYEHDPNFFGDVEHMESMRTYMPHVDTWARRFIEANKENSPEAVEAAAYKRSRSARP
jgi:hypothetical protein